MIQYSCGVQLCVSVSVCTLAFMHTWLVFELIEVCPVRTRSCICMWAELCVCTTSNDYDFVTAAKGAAEHKISLCMPYSSFIEISRVCERAPVCDSWSRSRKWKGSERSVAACCWINIWCAKSDHVWLSMFVNTNYASVMLGLFYEMITTNLCQRKTDQCKQIELINLKGAYNALFHKM